MLSNFVTTDVYALFKQSFRQIRNMIVQNMGTKIELGRHGVQNIAITHRLQRNHLGQSCTHSWPAQTCMGKLWHVQVRYQQSKLMTPLNFSRYLPPERWQHNLEHGVVVLLYHPCLNVDRRGKQQLARLIHTVRGCIRKHIITPSRRWTT